MVFEKAKKVKEDELRPKDKVLQEKKKSLIDALGDRETLIS